MTTEIYYIDPGDGTRLVLSRKGKNFQKITLETIPKVSAEKISERDFNYWTQNNKIVSRDEIIGFITKHKIPFKMPEIQLSMFNQLSLF